MDGNLVNASRSPAPGAGKVLANYTVLRELGARARSTYAATRTQDGRREIVVLEQCARGTKGPSAEEAATFMRDARLLTTLTHPNVCRVRAVDVVTSEVLVASDWVDGEPLESLLEASSGPKPELEMHVRILVDLLAGLHAIHTLKDAKRAPAGLFHGEVGPSNVLVGADGVVRLVHVARPRPIKGAKESPCVRYLAPEVLLEDASADHRADLYSVGVMLWEAITGTRLHEARTGGQILSQQLGGRVDPPKAPANAPWAAPLGDVVMRALATDPMARYNSAGQMTTDLRRAAGARIAPLSKLAAWVEAVAGPKIRNRRGELFGDSPPPAAKTVARAAVGLSPATPASAIVARAPSEESLSATLEVRDEATVSLVTEVQEKTQVQEKTELQEKTDVQAASLGADAGEDETDRSLTLETLRTPPKADDSKPKLAPKDSDSKPKVTAKTGDAKAKAASQGDPAKPKGTPKPLEIKPRAGDAPPAGEARKPPALPAAKRADAAPPPLLPVVSDHTETEETERIPPARAHQHTAPLAPPPPAQATAPQAEPVVEPRVEVIETSADDEPRLVVPPDVERQRKRRMIVLLVVGACGVLLLVAGIAALTRRDDTSRAARGRAATTIAATTATTPATTTENPTAATTAVAATTAAAITTATATTTATTTTTAVTPATASPATTTTAVAAHTATAIRTATPVAPPRPPPPVATAAPVATPPPAPAAKPAAPSKPKKPYDPMGI